MKKELRKKVWLKYDKHCAYCGCELEYKDMQVDHIVPLYKNWTDEEVQKYKKEKGSNDFKNLAPSCRQCNFYKGTFTIEEFRSNLLKIHDNILKSFLVKIGLKYGIIEFKKPFDGKFYFEKYKQNLN